MQNTLALPLGHDEDPAVAIQRKITSNSSRLQKCIAMFSMAVCLPPAFVIVCGICMLLFAGKGPGTRDYVCYLASGRLLAQRTNPYDSDAVLQIERETGFPREFRSMIMRNPPSALLPTLPLSFLGARPGAIVWAWLSLACLVTSVRMLWTMNGSPKGLTIVLFYTFAPALACLLAGQIALFALLGLVLFLRLHNTRPFLSGVSLWLCALRPHLFLPFCVVLILWIVATRSYKILLGAVAALALGTAIPLLLDPLVWTHYLQMMVHHSGMESEFIPSLGVALRLWLSPGSTWLQAIPTVIACVWAASYYWKHRLDWDWMAHGSILTLTSLLAAPYTWFFDQVLAIPALMRGAYSTRSSWMLAILALASAAHEIQLLRGPSMHSTGYLFTAPAWLIWYLFATRPSHGQKELLNPVGALRSPQSAT
jgi:Glycosyltransferase family 87